MNFTNFIVCAIFVAISAIAIIPSDTVASRKDIRYCGFKRCNASHEVCVRQQVKINSTYQIIGFESKCVNSTGLPRNVTGLCANVLCLEGYTCVLPRQRFFRHVMQATCKIVPVRGKSQNGTRRN
ncbi:unnamed protein product [Allacma fusca]|uniref:Uncharacterized protein n=1 Tax=Allacma fusca TaxID=39272 RepID=A0A8J2LA46_9HEXA|nr:unnamed protein product [Allacma fusca]